MCDAAVIIKYIDQNFEGTCTLLPKEGSVYAQRYKKFCEAHDAWEVELYTFGYLLKMNTFVKGILPTIIGK